VARAAEATLLIAGLVLVGAEAHADIGLTIGAQLGVESFDYAERLPLPAKSTEHGFLPTLGLQATLTSPSPLFARVLFLASMGSVDYDGSVIDPQTGDVSPATSTTKERMLQPEADAGLRYAEGGYAFSAYGGVGARYWRRDLTTSASGYVEDYRWGYGVAGVMLEVEVEPFVIAFDGALMPGFAGGMTAHLDSLDPRIADTETKPKAKLGGRIRIPIDYRFDAHARFGLLFTYEASSFDPSPQVTLVSKSGEPFTTPDGKNLYTIYEPGSSTHRYGVAITGTLLF
jgi:hypothetical protein